MIALTIRFLTKIAQYHPDIKKYLCDQSLHNLATKEFGNSGSFPYPTLLNDKLISQ